jgi:hypothetical protein
MKKIFILLAVVAAVIIVAAGALYFSFFASGPMATLVIDSGNVQVKTADVWQDASNGMTLKQGYGIRTLENSAAKIIILNSVMRLDANTEIVLDNLNSQSVSISQLTGRTWSKILKISGLSSYEVSTPDAIATVRGTAFSIDLGNGTRIAVGEGNVSVQINGTEILEILEANKEATIIFGDDSIEETDILFDEWIKANMQQDEAYKAELKAKLKSKYSFLLDVAKNQGANNTEIDQAIDDWLNGKISVKQEIEKGSIPSSIARMIPPELKRY